MNFRSLIILVVFFLSFSACRKCETGDFFMHITFYSEEGMRIEPAWDRVYGLGTTVDLDSDGQLTDFPIDLSRDSTTLIFEKDGQYDTLAFRYDRELFSGRGAGGYCLELKNEALLPLTTFEVSRFVFESASSGGVHQEYAVDIEL